MEALRDAPSFVADCSKVTARGSINGGMFEAVARRHGQGKNFVDPQPWLHCQGDPEEGRNKKQKKDERFSVSVAHHLAPKW